MEGNILDHVKKLHFVGIGRLWDVPHGGDPVPQRVSS